MMKSKPMSLKKVKFAMLQTKIKNVAIISKELSNAEKRCQRLLGILLLNSKLLDSFLANVLLMLIIAAWQMKNMEILLNKSLKLDWNQLRNFSIAHSNSLLLCKVAEDILIKLWETSTELLQDLCFEKSHTCLVVFQFKGSNYFF